MVEFRFDLKPLFPVPIVSVTSNLLPHTFSGDRRQALDVTSKMSEIIDELGQLSAVSQKLQHPVTSAQRLRKSDNQVIYLLADVNAGRNGKLLGLLKVGTKDLYLFDGCSNSRKIDRTPCILDFYIHESRQRTGLGKKMFEAMLAEEKWLPVKCTVDRPSDKLLDFLKKHYKLERIIPQANNFVLYEGFFDDEVIPANTNSSDRHSRYGMNITNSPNTHLFGAHFTGDECQSNKMRDISVSSQQSAPNGRYGARRPQCSMAEIIHSGAMPSKRDVPTGRTSHAHHDTLDLIGQNFSQMADKMQQMHVNEQYRRHEQNEPQDDPEIASMVNDEFIVNNERPQEESLKMGETRDDYESNENHIEQSIDNDNNECVRKPTTFTLSKQHTGMKNRSFGVGMAVTPTPNIDFNQGGREDFHMMKIHHPVGSKLNSPPDCQADINDDVSTTSLGAEGLTEQGYHDLKFFHNRLW